MRAAPTTIEVNGFTVREFRKRAGLEVSELAEAAGVGHNYITKIELGYSRRVSPKVFAKMVATLGVDDRRALLANPHGDTAAQDTQASA